MFTCGLTLLPPRADADQNWDGDDPVGNFSNNQNWFGNVQPGWGFSNGSLRFSYRNNSSQTSIYYNYVGWVDTNDITWDSTFGAGLTWDGNGNGINFNQRLENNSSFTQIVGSMNLSGGKNGAPQIELNPVNGNLVLNGILYNDNSKPYVVYGNNAKTLTLNTALGVGGTASNVSFTVAQNSNVVFGTGYAQTYTGATNVNAGTLTINGSTHASSGVTITSGATLKGSGTVGGTTTINGTHAPGDSAVGQQTFGSTLNYGSTSVFQWEIDVTGANSAVYDSVVANALSGSDAEFQILLAAGDLFSNEFWNSERNWTAAVLFGVNNAATNLASLFSDGNTAVNFGANSGEGMFSFTGTGSNTLTWTPVPEPTSAMAGLLLAAGMLRRKRR